MTNTSRFQVLFLDEDLPTVARSLMQILTESHESHYPDHVRGGFFRIGEIMEEEPGQGQHRITVRGKNAPSTEFWAYPSEILLQADLFSIKPNRTRVTLRRVNESATKLFQDLLIQIAEFFPATREKTPSLSELSPATVPPPDAKQQEASLARYLIEQHSVPLTRKEIHLVNGLKTVDQKILRLLWQGKNGPEIGIIVGWKPGTIRNHISSLRVELGEKIVPFQKRGGQK